MEQDGSSTRVHHFTAHVELTLEHSGTHVTARLYELSREHCRVDISNPPPLGTAVLVKVYTWPYFSQVRGTVCHSDPNVGVVAFCEIEPRYISVLNACLREIEEKENNG
jgi:hypothetical protein